MKINMKWKAVFALLLLQFSHNAYAISLAEYGVTITDTGLVDHVSGLRWLDSDISDGGLGELQQLLDQGWRIASEGELLELLARAPFGFSGNVVSQLGIDGINQIAESLSFSFGATFGGPWVCRTAFYPVESCLNTDALGGQFLLEAEELANDTTLLIYAFYISEVPIYGAFDCDFIECSYLGRSLMVRAVPVPPAGWLLLAGLVSLCTRGKRVKA